MVRSLRRLLVDWVTLDVVRTAEVVVIFWYKRLVEKVYVQVGVYSLLSFLFVQECKGWISVDFFGSLWPK